jgi:hypothetical protein
MLRWIAWSIAILLLAAVTLLLLPGESSRDSAPSEVAPAAATTAVPAVEAPPPGPAPAAAQPDRVDLSDAVLAAYLEREQDRALLRDYFAEPEARRDQADEVWRLIETLETEGRVLAFEGLHLKMAWLEVNSASEAEFRERAEALLQDYRERARAAAQRYDPADVPGFNRYKELEREIIAEVQAMSTFPDGMDRQTYLRQRLQAARIEAYGGAGH